MMHAWTNAMKNDDDPVGGGRDPNSQWARLAADLRAYREAQRRDWGDLDEAAIARYLYLKKDETTEEERARVEQAMRDYPKVRECVDVLRGIIQTPSKWDPFASVRRLAPYALAACLLVAAGLTFLVWRSHHSSPRDLPWPREKPAEAQRQIVTMKSKGHPETAAGSNNLDKPLRAQGKYAEAEAMSRRALAIRLKALGEGHPKTIESYSNLAANLAAQGKPSEAEPLFQKAKSAPYSPGSPQIIAMNIEQYRGEGDETETIGTLGVDSPSALEKDLVRVSAKLDRPAYCYVIAFNPDGHDQLYYPPDRRVPPPQSAEIDYPMDKGYFRLNDGAGLQAFVLVASNEPLPPYDRWRSGLGQVPWQPTQADGVWRSGSQGLELAMALRGGSTEPSEPPPMLSRLYRFLGTRPGVAAVGARAFPVKPQRAELPLMKGD
jgi:hypothetical protein